MRTKIIIGLSVLAFAAIIALISLAPAKPRAGPWKLADGSELSFAGVTYGKNHAMRYGNGIADYLYPLLTPALRKRFGCKVATVTTPMSNTIVVWLWHKNLPPRTSGFAPHSDFRISVVDENGLESPGQPFASASVLWKSTNLLEGMCLVQYPLRSRELQIRIRSFHDNKVCGEAKILNRAPTNYPIWRAETIPLTVRTNDLEISMVRFETGVVEKGIKSDTVAEFRITKDQRPCDDWIMRWLSAQSATGEHFDSQYWRAERYGWGGIAIFKSVMPLWLEEPAWKLGVEFWRTTNYPPTELWIVRQLALPAEGEKEDLNLTTNFYGSEIELIGISRGKSLVKTNTDLAPVVMHVTSPIPAPDKLLLLVDVKDDHRRKVDFHLDHEIESTGGRGVTIRELDKDYFLYPDQDATNLTVTLVYTKTLTVEFLAKPTLAKTEDPK